MKNNIIACYTQSIEWIKTNTIPEKGIVMTSKEKAPYLEVTGYMIPTLLEVGEHQLAEQYAEFVSIMQRPNGGFAARDGKTYVFDSGQVLRGLLAAARYWERFAAPAKKAADFILASMDSEGRIPSVYSDKYPEAVHVFCLPALLEAGKQFNNPAYNEAAKRSAAYYKQQYVFDGHVLTHYLAYVLDGFIGMGEKEFARPFAEKVFALQKGNGSIPAMTGTSWACSVGLAQFAIIGYKLGMSEQADKAVRCLCSLQNGSGGFFGSYGRKAGYFPDEEISWAPKFFIDAINTKITSFFNVNAHIFPNSISDTDIRLQPVLAHFGDLSGKKVLDAGCGNGRFAAKLKEKFPGAEMHGVDISSELLKDVPSSITTRVGSLLNLPYEPESFDCAVCVEALEHTILIERAIEELCRVVKDNGKVVIIDKNIEKLGRVKMTDFEQWFDKNAVKAALSKHCGDVQAEEIIHENQKTMFLVWKGTKKQATLTADEWHNVMITDSVNKAADRIKRNDYPLWCTPLLRHTSPNDAVLELGSGTGELSAVLGLYGRHPHLLDYAPASIDHARALLEALALHGQYYCASVLERLPLNDNTVQWSFSSGLLEHFTDDQMLFILRECSRVSSKGVMSLVPNATSLLYRIGKYEMEQKGTWSYGTEDPKYSLRHLFQQAGLKNIVEYSVATSSIFRFWGRNEPAVRSFFKSLSVAELEKMNQGYLLFTYGEK